MSVQFAVLASGSQGNATLIQAEGMGVLLDLGLGPRTLMRRLESVGSHWERIAVTLLTHTHGDHVDDGTLHLLARSRVRLFCHEGHRLALRHLTGFQALEAQGLLCCYDDRPFLTPGGFEVEPLELRHDGGPTFGFRLGTRLGRRGRRVALGYLADTGCWSEPMADALIDVDLLGVEFNHDVELQRTSRRPAILIARNLGDKGHLSNEQGAELVATVLDRSSPGAVRHLVLLHLSQQCNRPNLAVDQARQALRGRARRVAIHAARQHEAYPNLWVAPRRRSFKSRSVEHIPEPS